MRRWIPVVLILLVTGCTGSGEPGAESSAPASSDATASTSTSGSPSTGAQPVPHRVSLPTLAQKKLDSGRLKLGDRALSTASHTQYDITYRSGGRTVSGRLAVPNGKGPFPAVVLAHGYIDPAIYAVGQGMTRERAWLGDRGYVALHVDYRGHGASDPDRSGGLDMRMGYTEDVLNAVLALRAWDGPVDDEQVALVGRSMGGGVVYNALVAHPGLVDAAVVFAPVSSDAVDNFERWIRPDPTRDGVARTILRRYGEPAKRPEFWAGISAQTYFDKVSEPVLIHHGTADDTCPPRWSRETARLMRAAGIDVTLRTYAGEGHAFGPQFDESMQRTDRFLRRHLA